VDAETALEDIDETLDVIQDLEDNYDRTWDRGQDFLEDVRAKLTEVRETIEENGFVTSNQEKAIYNWGKGVRNWHPEYK
jgi:peptidoglycan hydrolase CwlO-like protein